MKKKIHDKIVFLFGLFLFIIRDSNALLLKKADFDHRINENLNKNSSSIDS